MVSWCQIYKYYRKYDLVQKRKIVLSFIETLESSDVHQIVLRLLAKSVPTYAQKAQSHNSKETSKL
jgi:hypothetical protein